MKKRINVTKKDIVHARDFINLGYIYSKSCPIALATKRTFKKNKVSVEHDCILIEEKRYNLSMRARKFINKFDNFNRVKPFKFILDIS